MMKLDEFFRLNKGERWAYLKRKVWRDGIDTHSVTNKGPFDQPQWVCKYCHGPGMFKHLTSFDEPRDHCLTEEHKQNKALKRLEG